jgi:energy-coupling factor transport system substrate-specific component
MTVDHPVDHPQDPPRAPLSARPLATGHLVGIAASVVAGVAIWTIGLPSSVTLFDTRLSDLTVAAALFVALTGISVVGATSVGVPWRVVDMVVGSVFGVAGGLFLWGVAAAWDPMTKPLTTAYPPLSALLGGLWLVPGVLGGLVIRKPGAALYAELVAAVVEALLGNQWGFSTVYYGVVEGLGAEFVLALLLYRRFGLPTAVLTGAGSGLTLGLLDVTVYFPTFIPSYKLVYLVLAILSGAVIAGAGAWALTRALATTGALGPLASTRTAERV